MTPTQRRALHPDAVVEAWDWIDIYARHWATAGRDWQTLDNLGGEMLATGARHLDTLREAGLIEADQGFRGNFIKRPL